MVHEMGEILLDKAKFEKIVQYVTITWIELWCFLYQYGWESTAVETNFKCPLCGGKILFHKKYGYKCEKHIKKDEGCSFRIGPILGTVDDLTLKGHRFGKGSFSRAGRPDEYDVFDFFC